MSVSAGRRVAVHHRLAGDHARAAPLGRGEERVDRLRDGRCNRPAPSSCRSGTTRRERIRAIRGAMGRIGELLLFDEGVFVQPVEQLRAVGADDAGSADSGYARR